jgi:hypothetical protein
MAHPIISKNRSIINFDETSFPKYRGNSGYTCYRKRIFRNILPFRVTNPVLMASASGFPLDSTTFEPSYSQQLGYFAEAISIAGDFAIGTDSPVKLASFR